MLVNLLINLGFTRDDQKWFWGRVVGAAAAVASGIFDLHYWAEYVGLHPSVTAIHIVNVVAITILWVSGKQDRSHLPPDLSK